jgi:hypothetical protein
MTIRDVATVTALISAALSAALHRVPVQTYEEQKSPALVVLDSLVLVENDSQFVGKSSGIVTSRSGSYFIGDALNMTVHQFSPQGRYVRSWGRRGRGPGEFTSVGTLALDGDSLLLVDGGSQLQVFDLRTGKPKWQRRLPTRQSLFAFVADRGRVFFNAVDATHRSTLGLVTTADDSAKYSGPYPAPLGRNKLVDQYLSFLEFAVFSGDSVAVALQNTDYLFLGRFGSARFDSVRIGRVTRRGSRPELLRTMTEDPASVQPHLYSFSVPWALGRLSSGQFAYITTDQTFVTNRLIGTLFASVVDPRTRRTCPDAEIPVPKDPQPWITFRGDTMLVVSQELSKEAKPRTVIRRFSFRTEGCRWIS